MNPGLIRGCWIQRAVKAINVHTFPNKTKMFKEALSTCRKAYVNCFLGQEDSANGGIHATRDYSNVISALPNTRKLHRAGNSEQNKWNAGIRCCAPPWQCASAYSYPHSSISEAFQQVAVWLSSVQPWSRSERLPLVYVRKELVAITELQQ
jgi:hypothetical protein